jgi:hypothetical protein
LVVLLKVIPVLKAGPPLDLAAWDSAVPLPRRSAVIPAMPMLPLPLQPSVTQPLLNPAGQDLGTMVVPALARLVVVLPVKLVEPVKPGVLAKAVAALALVMPVEAAELARVVKAAARVVKAADDHGRTARVRAQLHQPQLHRAGAAGQQALAVL